MPNIKSAIKRVKTAERNRLRNRAYKSQIRTVQSRLEDVLKSADTKEIDTHLSGLYVAIDKAVAKGVLHKNTAARKKSRLAKKAFALKNSGK
ncbi:MAG: 30S ribosomal protein S20 [Candidatus Melainabacteria bacterium]|nr:30S ribosomal protein S20 [Candidatus Melainabacteria bacterium]